MSVADLQELEEVKGLIVRGLQVGVLTDAEIATATAELGLEETDVEELHGLFERCEIELVEEIDPATAACLVIERAPEKRTSRKPAPDLKPGGTTDGLQLFLKQIGKMRLLSAQEEVDLAKRIERGTASGACSSCATASAAGTRAHSTRSGAGSTSRASESARSSASRSRSSGTSTKPSSCATTPRSLPALRCAGSGTETRRPW
jgi:hypothetical protein